MSNAEPKSPLTIIAIFAGIIEASALASLPFLGEDSQGIYTWFLVGFPFFLTVLFFLTLNFNYRSLYSPSVIDPGAPSVTATSPQPSVKATPALDDSPQRVMHAQADDESGNAVPLQDIATTCELAGHPQQTQTTITIYVRGKGARQQIEQFAAQALHQACPPYNTWVLCNLDAGTRTTLATRAIKE